MGFLSQMGDNIEKVWVLGECGWVLGCGIVFEIRVGI